MHELLLLRFRFSEDGNSFFHHFKMIGINLILTAAFAASLASALPPMLLDGEWRELEGGQTCHMSQHADTINASLTMSVLATLMTLMIRITLRLHQSLCMKLSYYTDMHSSTCTHIVDSHYPMSPQSNNGYNTAQHITPSDKLLPF